MANEPEAPGKPGDQDKPVKRVRVTGSIQESIARSTAQLRERKALQSRQSELEKVRDQIVRMTAASATGSLQADIERVVESQRGLQRWQEQMDLLSSRSALLKLMKGTEQSALMTIGERIRKQMEMTESALGGLGISQHLVPRIGSVVEQFQLGSAFARADLIGRATDGFWLAEVKRRLQPIGAQQGVMEAAFKALRPLSQQDQFQAYVQDVLKNLQDAGPELQEEVEAASDKLATEALAEPTPESAYRKFLELLGHLDPVRQFLVRLITNQFFQALLLVCLTPVVDHYVRTKWLEDSPQGQIKRANERVVRDAGGTLVLENFRLVVHKKRLPVHGVPAAASKVIATIPTGTPVLLVKESEAFSLVEWREEDSVVSGWVFTRYLKKFK